MGSPGVVEGKQTMKILLTGAFLAVALAAPRPPLRLLPLLRPMLIPGMDTMDMEDTEAIMVTMERGLLRLSLLLRPLLPPRLRLIPGMDTMDTGHMAMDTTDTGLMAMDTTMARGPQMLSLLLRPMPLLGPMLIRGMDTTDTEDTEVIMAMPDL